MLRLPSPDGGFLASGPLISAANRYQLLPSVDRWVAARALQQLAPYRGMIRSRGISLPIDVSGQSIGDEAFIALLAEQLRAAALSPGRDCSGKHYSGTFAAGEVAASDRLVD